MGLSPHCLQRSLLPCAPQRLPFLPAALPCSLGSPPRETTCMQAPVSAETFHLSFLVFFFFSSLTTLILPSPCNRILSVSMNLRTQGTSFKWNHTAFVHTWPISLSRTSSNFIHVVTSARLSFLFRGRITVHCVYTHPSSFRGRLAVSTLGLW